MAFVVFLAAIGPALGFQSHTAPNLGNPSALEDFRAGDAYANWEGYQRATDDVKALEVSKGDWVADMGAGAGYNSTRLSNLVGAAGKVYAEDISGAAMRWLPARLRRCW